MPVPQKVTEPNKIVTDPVLLKELARKGIDKDYVEFFQDYAPRSLGKGHSPYAKFYRDLKSGKRFMVVSGLPMVNALGRKIEVGWLYAKGKYYAKANLFSAVVKGKQVKLTCLSDQPDGTKKGERVVYAPRLFIGGIEILNGEQPALLPVDPINSNYKGNTLEWNYGKIGRRRIRIIEGRYRDKFFILSHPHGRVSVKNNCVGSLKLKLGRAIDAEGNPLKVNVIGDEEIIEASEFDRAIYPVEIGASSTFYPDAHIESTSVDGYVRHDEALIWQNLVGAAGTSADDDDVHLWAIRLRSRIAGDNWLILDRSIFLFDTSALGAGAVVSAATLSIYGGIDLRAKVDANSATPDINIYSSNPNTNTALIAGDFDTLGTTPFCDTAITYAGWTEGDPGASNDFVLNAAGILAIIVDGISKFGLRNANYDVAEELDPGNHAPPSGGISKDSGLGAWTTDQGAGYKPKLVVTYTAVTEKTSSETGSGTDAGASLSSAYSLSETGSGSEALGSRLLGAMEAGVGVETLLARLLAGAETASGLDAGGLFFTSGDVGSGSDAFLALKALLTGADSGSGIDTTSLIKALLSTDSGLGTDAIAALLARVVTGELVVGFDCLVVKVESAPTGGGMKLPPGGKTSIPSRRVNL